MKFFIILFSLIIIELDAIGQVPAGIPVSGGSGPINPALADMMMKIQKGDTEYRGVEGSPYLSNEWSNGSIFTDSGKEFPNLSLKYDLVDNRILYRSSEQADIYILNSDIIEAFTIQLEGMDSTIYFQKMPLTDDHQYYQIIYDGKYSLVAELKKQLVKNDTRSPGNSGGDLKDQFITRKSIYLVRPDSNMIRIKRRKKAFISLFPEHTDKLGKFVRSQELNMSQDADLAKIIAYYDNLSQD